MRRHAQQRWSTRLTTFFAELFESAWFAERQSESLEVPILLGPRPPAGCATAVPASGVTTTEDAAALVATKTARQLATRVLTQRFNVLSRWETVDVGKAAVRLEYPVAYTFYPDAHTPKLHRLVVFCHVGDDEEPPKRRRGV